MLTTKEAFGKMLHWWQHAEFGYFYSITRLQFIYRNKRIYGLCQMIDQMFSSGEIDYCQFKNMRSIISKRTGNFNLNDFIWPTTKQGREERIIFLRQVIASL